MWPLAAARRRVAPRAAAALHGRSPSRCSRSPSRRSCTRSARPAAPDPAYYSAFARAWELGLGALLALLAVDRRLGRRSPRPRVARPGGDRRGHGRVRRRDPVPGPGGAAADARRGRAARGRDGRAAPRRRRGRSRCGRCGGSGGSRTRGTSGTGRCSCSPAPRGGRVDRRALAVVWLVRADVPPTAGSRSRCGARRCTCAGPGSRSPPGWPARRWRSASASRCPRASPHRPRWPRARPSARRSSRARGRSSGRRPPCGRAARRRRRPRPLVRRRLPRRRAEVEVARLHLRRPALEDDRRAVRRLARDAVLPRAREDREAPALAAGRADQGRLPAGARAGALTSGSRGEPAVRRWRENTLRRIEAERPALVVVGSSVRYTVLDGGRSLDTPRVRARSAPGTRRRSAAAGGRRPRGRADRRAAAPAEHPVCVSGALQAAALRVRARPGGRGRAVRDAASERRGDQVDRRHEPVLPPDLCPAVIGDVLVYRNSGHVTASFITTLAPWLERHLPRL